MEAMPLECWSSAARALMIELMHRFLFLLSILLGGCFDAHPRMDAGIDDAAIAIDDAGAIEDAGALVDAPTIADASRPVRCTPMPIAGPFGEACFCNGPVALGEGALYRRGVGLEVYDLESADAPELVSTIDERPSSTGALLFSPSRHALFSVTDVEPGVWIYDVSSPLSPSLLTRLELSGYVVGGALDGDTLVAIASDEGTAGTLHVIDVSSPASPSLVSSIPLDAAPSSVALQGSTAAVVTQTGEPTALVVIDVASGATLATLPLSGGGFGRALALDGDLVYVTGGDVVLTVLRLEGSTLRVIGALEGAGSFGRAVVLDGTRALVGGDRLRVVELADPEHPRAIGESEGPLGDVGGIVWQDTLAYVSNGNGFSVVALGCE